MIAEKKVIYTDSAKARLEKFHDDIQTQLEHYIQERKFVPGDDFIEVTASDIDNSAQRFKILPTTRQNPMKVLVPTVYTFLGTIFTVIGLFYSQFKLIVEGDPRRLVFIIGGILMITTSWLYAYMLKARERKNELERYLFEAEKRMYEYKEDREMSKY